MVEAIHNAKTGKAKTARNLLSIVVSACLDLSPLVVLSSILINILSLFMPLAIMQVYDRLIPKRAIESLSLLVGLIVLAILFEAVFRIARNHIVSWSATTLAWRTHREVLKRFMAAPAHLIEGESASRNLDRIQALMVFAEWHGSPSRLVLVDLPFVILYIGLMVIVGHSLAAVPILLFCLLGATVHRKSVVLRKMNISRAAEDMKTRDFLVETLSGLQTIKSGAIENQMVRRFERLQETVAHHSFSAIKLSEETQAYTGLLSNMTQMITVTVGAVIAMRGDISVGALACCVMLAGRAIQPLLRCVAVWNELQSVVVGLEKAEPILNLPRAQDYVPSTQSSGPLDVSFSNVSFGHRAQGPMLLNGVSFVVPAGSITAISGRDGSGKSTIADLISGYIPDYAGTISVGQLDPHSDVVSLKKCIAIVRPGVSMMRGSIIDNITMFRKGADVEMAIRAARLIGLDADICKLPLGYQTIMSEGLTAELPAGLVQRIAIARAISRKPGLLILDEANGALDMRSDQLLVKGLTRIRSFVTVIVITNRPSIAAIADQKLRLENGKLEVEHDVSMEQKSVQSVQVAP